MEPLKYTIQLTPRTKKNSQQILVNSKTGRPFIMPSKQYKAYETAALSFLLKKPEIPIDFEVNVKCLFYLPTKRKTDLTNLLEAIDDILVRAGILLDDNYNVIAAHDGSRCLYDKHNPRTEIEITRIAQHESAELIQAGKERQEDTDGKL